MLEKLLFHTNQIDNIEVKSVDYFSDKIVFNVLFKPIISCPCCGHTDASSKGVKTRGLRIAPLGNKAAWLSVETHRLRCRCCDHIWWPKMPFTRSKKRTTISFEKHVIELMKFSTVEDVAKLLGVSWHFVKDIHKAHLQREYQQPELKEIQYIGVDEFAIYKGHKYMTIFIDLQTGVIIHAVEGKSIACVTPFMQQLKKEATHLKAMAMDMNAAYASAAKEIIPTVDIVFDRFHVISMLNTVVDEVRRDQQAKCESMGYKILKGMRFLLLSNYERLGSKTQARLNKLLEINKPIALAHAMKEQIILLWSKETSKAGAHFLCSWIMDAVESGIQRLETAARTLIRHGMDVLNYFKHPITNGRTEGINNKIKTLKRKAYGFRDNEYFKLRLYSLHTTRYSSAR